MEEWNKREGYGIIRGEWKRGMEKENGNKKYPSESKTISDGYLFIFIMGEMNLSGLSSLYFNFRNITEDIISSGITNHIFISI